MLVPCHEKTINGAIYPTCSNLRCCRRNHYHLSTNAISAISLGSADTSYVPDGYDFCFRSFACERGYGIGRIQSTRDSVIDGCTQIQIEVFFYTRRHRKRPVRSDVTVCGVECHRIPTSCFPTSNLKDVAKYITLFALKQGFVPGLVCSPIS